MLYQSGVPDHLIELYGDWRSDAYKPFCFRIHAYPRRRLHGSPTFSYVLVFFSFSYFCIYLYFFKFFFKCPRFGPFSFLGSSMFYTLNWPKRAYSVIYWFVNDLEVWFAIKWVFCQKTCHKFRHAIASPRSSILTKLWQMVSYLRFLGVLKITGQTIAEFENNQNLRERERKNYITRPTSAAIHIIVFQTPKDAGIYH